MTATFYVGDAIKVMDNLPEKSVDLILTSPPFLALRSYLPADHPDKALEGGSQSTPGEYVDWLLDVVEACARVLAPHGSLVFELGDTYSGSGGGGGDYLEGGWREGQAQFAGSASSMRESNAAHWRQKNATKDAWPLSKSLSLIPETFRFAMVYGHNPHTGRTTAPWRLRNVIRWVRPNPPVGALGDKFRPATSELMVFCKAKDRFFDLDAVRGEVSEWTQFYADRPVPKSERWQTEPSELQRQTRGTTHNQQGAPPLDWWNIPPGGYSGFTTWTTKVPIDPATYDGFSGDIQRTVSADCPEHGDQVDQAPTGSHDGRGAIESNRNRGNGGRPARGLALGSVPTDQLPLLNPEDGSSDSPPPQSTPVATRRSKASRKTAPAPATSPPDTASDKTRRRIDDTSTEPPSDAPHPDTPENRTSEASSGEAPLGTPGRIADTKTERSGEACTCSYYVEKAKKTSHYAVWPPELLIKPVKAMCPVKVCRTCGQPSRRIVEVKASFDQHYALARHIKDRRIASGYSLAEVNGWFGYTPETHNWETSGKGISIPNPDDWPIIKERLGLSDEFDELVFGDRRWTESTVDYLTENGQVLALAERRVAYDRGGLPPVDASRVKANRQAPETFSDCSHDDWRPGLILDPFAGTGTTLAVATGHGRDAIGIDLDERNFDLALDRVGPFILTRGEVAA